MVHESTNESQKLSPVFSNTGRAIKKTSDGITIQNIEYDKLLIFSISFVSVYNQMMAIMEVNGNDAKIAETVLKRFPSSAIPVIMSAVTTIFITILIINLFLLLKFNNITGQLIVKYANYHISSSAH